MFRYMSTNTVHAGGLQVRQTCVSIEIITPREVTAKRKCDSMHPLRFRESESTLIAVSLHAWSEMLK